MRILILTQYYLPEIGAAQARLSVLAEQFAKYGHRVTVMTAMPNYPHGAVYPGYRGLIRREILGGVEIIRTGIITSRKAAAFSRLVSFFSFALTSLILGSWFVRSPDIILTESPPLFLGLTGFLMSRWKRARFIFNVSDLWPESAVHLGVVRRESWAYKLSEKLEAFCYRKAWIVTGQSLGILQNILNRFPDVRTYLIPNGVDISWFDNHSIACNYHEATASKERFTLIYAGLHGLAQGLDQIIRVARLIGDEYHFVLIGGGPEKASLVALRDRLQISNVEFLDSKPREEIPSLLAKADIILVPLTAELPGAIPSKLFEAMASGKPLILVATGEPAEVVSQYNAGLIVEPHDIVGLRTAIETFRRQPELGKKMAENGRRAVETNFDRKKITAQFISYLDTILSTNGR